MRASGFTLVVVSLLLVVMGMMIAMSILKSGMTNINQKSGSTIKTLNMVESRLTGFIIKNGRLPCPADGQYAENTYGFGTEAGTPGSCIGNSSPTPNAPLGPDAGTGYVVGGVIPTKALDLGDEYGYDEWGRRITYVVDTRATKNASCMTLQNFPTNNGKGGVTIEQTTGGTVLDNVMHAFISHGPDGHGAWPAQGSVAALTSAQSAAMRINAGSIDTDELTNAGVNSSFTYNTTNFTNVKIMKDRTPTFGDILYYAQYQKNICCLGAACANAGIRIDGTVAGQAIGYENYAGGVATADLNGDGIPDLIISSNDGHGSIYVIFGQSNRNNFTPNPFLLPTSLNGTNGFEITNCWGGSSPTFITGDFNGDGIQDIAMNAMNKMVVVFGQRSGWPATMDLCSLSPTSNPKMITISKGNDGFGNPNIGIYNMMWAADVNNDGISDLIFGNNDGGGDTGVESTGDVYVIFGNATISNIATDSTTLNGTNGIHIEGYRTLGLGAQVAVGDFNHDGYNDMAIGSPCYGNCGSYPVSSSVAYIVWGHASSYVWPNSGVVDLGSLPANGSVGVEINQGGNPIPGGYFGEAINVGDVNGDGIDDLMIGGHNCTVDNNSAAGCVVTIFGKSSWTSNQFDVSTLDGSSNGSVLAGTWNSGGTLNTCNIIQPPGDINGDGKKDLIEYNPTYGGNSGTVTVVFGPTSGSWSSPLWSQSGVMNGSNGFIFSALSDNNLPCCNAWFEGFNWITNSDVNGDGIPDLMIGDPGVNSSTGAVYVVKGGLSGYNGGALNPANVSSYGYVFNGVNTGDEAGMSITTADFDHDGTKDIAIAAPGALPGSVSGAGSVYVIWGSTSLPATLNLSTITR